MKIGEAKYKNADGGDGVASEEPKAEYDEKDEKKEEKKEVVGGS